MTERTGGRLLPDWLDLEGTVSVITGGGTHLGKAMATALAELGSAVHLVGRRRDVVEAAAAELRAGGLDATAWCCDAGDEAAVAALVDDLVARRGRIDTVVCNAGGSVGADRVPEVRPADLAATLRKNVETTMVTAQAARG